MKVLGFIAVVALLAPVLSAVVRSAEADAPGA